MKSVAAPAVNKIEEKDASIFGAMLKRTADLSCSFQSKNCGSLSGQVVCGHIPLQQMPVSHVTYFPLGRKPSNSGHRCAHQLV